jgi:hypothetical protein
VHLRALLRAMDNSWRNLLVVVTQNTIPCQNENEQKLALRKEESLNSDEGSA